jgi:hypothetical protein
VLAGQSPVRLGGVRLRAVQLIILPKICQRMLYYEVHDRTDDSFGACAGRHERIVTPGGCRECGTLPRGGGPPEVLAVRACRTTAVKLFTSWGFGVIRRDLVELLGPEAVDCLRLGRLVTCEGRSVDGYQTFIGKERVVLRGNSDSQHRVCARCGALLYTYLPRNAPYVTPSSVESRRPIYEITAMQLLVSEVVRERIGDHWIDQLQFFEVPVRSEPLDGLPTDLGLWPTAEQLVGYRPNLPRFRQP